MVYGVYGVWLLSCMSVVVDHKMHLPRSGLGFGYGFGYGSLMRAQCVSEDRRGRGREFEGSLLP